MIQLIKILPVIIGLLLGGAGTATLIKYITPEVKPCPACPSLTCPPQQQALEVEKLKNFKGTIKIEQHYEVAMNGDSLFIVNFIKEIESKGLKVVRCK